MRPLTISFLLLLCCVVLHAEEVSISTDPAGRKVIVDDRAPMETPAKILLPEGIHRIRLFTDPCLEAEPIAVTVENGAHLFVELKLKKRTKSITITTVDGEDHEMWATVSVDGDVLGTGSGEYEIPLCGTGNIAAWNSKGQSVQKRYDRNSTEVVLVFQSAGKNAKHKKKNHLKRYEKRTGYTWVPEVFFGFPIPNIRGSGTPYNNRKISDTFPVRYTLGFKYGPFAGILDSIMPRYDMPFFVGAKFRYYPWESPTDNYGYYISLGLGYGGRGVDTGIDIMFDTGFQITQYYTLSFFTEFMPMTRNTIILFGLRLDIMLGGFLMKDRSKRFVKVKGRLKKR